MHGRVSSRRKKLKIFLYTVILLVVFLLAVIPLILTQLDRNKRFIETRLSTAIHMPVSIDSVSSYWSGISPTIHFHGLVISDPVSQANVVQAKKIAVRVNILASLWHWRLMPENVMLEGLHLTAKQQSDGKWEINGVKTQFGSGATPLNIPEMLHSIPHIKTITLDHISIAIKNRANAQFNVNNLHLVLENQLFKHTLLAQGEYGKSPFSIALNLPKNENQAITGEIKIQANMDAAHMQPLGIQATAKIADIHQPILEMHVAANDTYNKISRVMSDLVINKTLNKTLKHFTYDGIVHLKLWFSLPLDASNKDPFQINGAAALAGGRLNALDGKIQLTDFQGNLLFNENGIRADNLQGKWFKQPITINIQTHNQGELTTTNVVINGKFSAEDVIQAYHISALSGVLKGATSFSAKVIASNKNTTSLALDSNLVGLNINLPKPFQKSAQQNMPLHSELQLVNDRLTMKLRLANLMLQGKQIANTLRVGVSHPYMNGVVIIPFDFSKTPIRASFRYMHIPLISKNATSASSAVSTPMQPEQFPAFDFIIRDLTYDNQPLGTLRLKTSHKKNSLNIDDFTVSFSDFSLAMNGRWTNQNNKPKTLITGSVIAGDLGELLKNWNITHSINKGAGSADFIVNWPDAIYSPKLNTIDASLSFDFKDGSVVNAMENNRLAAGISQILNLISFKGITTALSKPFSFINPSNDFDFDKLTGNITIQNGKACLENFIMDGHIAKVDAEGFILLMEESYDLDLEVTPYLTRSLTAASIVAGPIGFAATWLAQKLIGGVFNSFFKIEYQVTGPWSDPVMRKI